MWMPQGEGLMKAEGVYYENLYSMVACTHPSKSPVESRLARDTSRAESINLALA